MAGEEGHTVPCPPLGTCHRPDYAQVCKPCPPTPGLSLQETLYCHEEGPVHSDTRSPAAPSSRPGRVLRGLGGRTGQPAWRCGLQLLV